jgi:hypothetical protein
MFEEEFLFVRRRAGFILKLDQQTEILPVMRRRKTDDVRDAGSHSLRDHSFCNGLKSPYAVGNGKDRIEDRECSFVLIAPCDEFGQDVLLGLSLFLAAPRRSSG